MALEIIGGVVIVAVAVVLFLKMKKGVKKTTDLHEEREKNDPYNR